MARIRYRLSYSDTRAELRDHKDQKRGASEDAFWDEDELIDHRPKRGKKKKSPRKGCSGNDGNEHVYVWVDYASHLGYSRWNTYYGYYSRYEIKVCAGCLKRKRTGSFRIKQ